MLSTLITSKTRVKLLIKFFINGNVNGYLRNLESEFGESCNAIRVELNRFEKAGLLSTTMTGNKKIYRANIKHPYYRDLQVFLHKMVGIDSLIKEVIQKIPHVESAYLIGNMAKGIDSQIFDLALIGNNLDKTGINRLTVEYENNQAHKIRTLILKSEEKKDFINESTSLLIWERQNNSPYFSLHNNSSY